MISLREVMMVPDSLLVTEIGDQRPPLTVGPLMDREDVARLISKYNLLALPVVDEQDKMLGIVTVDDIIDALVSEQTEDVQKFGGMEVDRRANASGSDSSRCSRSAPAGSQILFVGRDAHRAGHAVFPGRAREGHGGGDVRAADHLLRRQFRDRRPHSLIIRAMALKEVALRDWWRVLVRELPAGLTLGTMLGSIGLCRILLWQWMAFHHFAVGAFALGHDYGPHYFLIALTVFFALIGVVLFGSLAGSMLPFILRRFRLDPASASAPFVATLVDVTGLVIYFTVAKIILTGTLL